MTLMITSTHSDYRNGSLNLQQSFYTNPDDQPTTNDNYQVKLEGEGGMMRARLAQLIRSLTANQEVPG